MNSLPTLKIGHLEINPPFILGGMGVRMTDHSLVSAAANCGMAGTIASVGLVDMECRGDIYVKASNEGLINEIRQTRSLSNGVIGVNIMVALTNYDELVKTAISENVDYIISGAGLPLHLPGLAEGSKTCLIPIASSARSADIICKRWWSSFKRLPDAIVVEGAFAGGHLGFKREDLADWNDLSLDSVCTDVLDVASRWEKETGFHIPIIAAGGVWNGADIARLLKLGVEGIQMGTRFLATEECGLSDDFKQLLIDSNIDDMVVINSPAGLPGRAIKNELIRKIMNGEKAPIRCPYRCLRTCDPSAVSFCIAKALVSAREGDIENGLLMAGHNAYRIKEIIPIKQLVDNLVNEALKAIAIAA